ncbi:hypothetical protein [Sphaerisporangium sp. TRM90804]|uniref:hypothetical protein n=1 Tax=Sphaerisporangium sp. TRM90804 TaxID=3031113 RepID=UPI0024467FCA|nr:hypothetical protein [Sphaerisporangium sp. TRM90804]MDH2425817.1 hypothetical protein [Sphaerisporangium sp. TRM90804]
MRRIRQAFLFITALAALLVVPIGAGTAWASPGAGAADTSGGTSLAAPAWTATPWTLDAHDPVAVKVAQAVVDRGYCTVVPGAGVRITLYCEIKVQSTLWVYCTGVTIEIPLPPGRWAPSGSCPGYRGYQLTA